MKFPFLPLLLLGTAGTLLADANPIRNSSFELGRAEFGIRVQSWSCGSDWHPQLQL